MTESTKVPSEEKESNRARESIDTEYVERTDVGISLTVKLTRGTGTRDQDKITAKVKAETLDEAREEMEILRTYVHDLAEDVRQIQPEYESE
ncbi:hypothetical protein V5735_13010 (plasmid) [Haladaptatus sp. SPP-AMP-3]|uniref:DUF7389 domain-containing protein n=1 Tax=Haladaptatus sp. SPP-AMP-3 TaxID=3121295 RepID=UPI003C3035E3